MSTPPPLPVPPTPYKIAVLVYVFNEEGKLLLLHRRKPPNKNLYSPIGGKLEQHLGESPYACALREIREEIGMQLTLDDIRLFGIVSERAYPSPPPIDTTHWLMFCFEVTRTLNFPAVEFDEGLLEWIDPIIVPQLSIPKTDREIIWPLVQKHSIMLNPATRTHPDFFSVHIDCTDNDCFVPTMEHPRKKSEDRSQ
ncbi:MAG TPA: NUDIX domain-containing protein [Phycisphaerae bacterium]|nr:NUDIX domain-containing protein [Phycisphaerae bacterium]